jgi:hypothetical protein
MREECPIWAPTGESNEKAEIGTRQHKAVEDRSDDDALTDEQMQAAVECVEYAEHVKNRLAKHCIVDEISEPYLEIDSRHFEFPVFDPKTYSVSMVDERTTTGGYADLLLLAFRLKHVEVLDWKFGRWEVTDARDNIQGWCYVLGAFRAFKWAKTVRLHFKQPALEKVSVHLFRRSDIPRLELKIKTIVDRAARSGGKLNPYEDAKPYIPGCLFCARRGECQALHEMVLNVAKQYHPIEFPSSLGTTFLRDPKEFPKGMRLAQVVEAWASGYRSQGTQQVILGQAPLPEGYQLTEYSRRMIADKERYKAIALDTLTPEEYEATTRPSLTAVEKAIAAKQPRGSKTEALNDFRDRLEAAGAVEKTPPVYYLGAIPKKKQSTDNQAE